MKHLLWTSLNRKNLSQRNNRLHRKRWLLAKEKENAEAVDESVKESEADKALDKLDETGEEETAGSSLSKDDELVKDMDLPMAKRQTRQYES